MGRPYHGFGYLKVHLAMIRKLCNQKEILTPKTEVGKNEITNQVLRNTKKIYCKPSEQLFSQLVATINYPNLTKSMEAYNVHNTLTAQKFITNT